MPSSVGLFVKLWGTVTQDAGSDYFTITDGSEAPVKVLCGTLAKPTPGQFVRVRGVVTTDGTSNVLAMRNEQVDWVYGSSSVHPLPMAGPVACPRDYIFLGAYGDETTDYATQVGIDYIAQATAGAKTESTIRPSLGDTVGDKTWFRHDGVDELVDLNRLFNSQQHCTIYAHVYVYSPVAQPVDLLVGADDSCRVWVNGTMVHEKIGIRGNNYGSDVVNVNLNAGMNSVLFKITQNDGGFGFVSQYAVPGTRTGEGWGKSTPLAGLGYLINKQP